MVSIPFSIPGVAVYYAFIKQKKQKRGGKKKEAKSSQFPRADEIEKERSRNYKQLKVDRSKVHVVCNVQEWENVLPLVCSNS